VISSIQPPPLIEIRGGEEGGGKGEKEGDKPGCKDYTSCNFKVGKKVSIAFFFLAFGETFKVGGGGEKRKGGKRCSFDGVCGMKIHEIVQVNSDPRVCRRGRMRGGEKGEEGKGNKRRNDLYIS